MKTNKRLGLLWILLAMLALPAVVQAQFILATNNGTTITITGYTGTGGVVNIPGTTNGLPVTRIGYKAFFNCTNLIGVTIPASVTSVENRAFFDCTSLSTITVDASNPAYGSVDGVSFDKHQTTLIQCPAGKAGNYTIPDSVTNIGGNAFRDCTRLASVMIPASVTSIGASAFAGCTSLTAIRVDASNSVYSSVGGVLFDKSQTTLIHVPAGKARPIRSPTASPASGTMRSMTAPTDQCRDDRPTASAASGARRSVSASAWPP